MRVSDLIRRQCFLEGIGHASEELADELFSAGMLVEKPQRFLPRLPILLDRLCYALVRGHTPPFFSCERRDYGANRMLPQTRKEPARARASRRMGERGVLCQSGR